MGSGIAHVFAQFGFKVILNDISKSALEKAQNSIAKNLDRMEKGKITTEIKDRTLKNLKISTDFKEAASHADLVVEAATENETLKLKIFTSFLDQICAPNTILASNTSSISITKIASATKRPDKVIGMHFMNPAPIMKLIEIIRGYNTSDPVTEIIMDLSRALDKVPVEVNDSPDLSRIGY